MANPEHLAKLKEGVRVFNAWRWDKKDVLMLGYFATLGSIIAVNRWKNRDKTTS